MSVYETSGDSAFVGKWSITRETQRLSNISDARQRINDFETFTFH